jgi:hypothetical protein
MGHQLAHNTSRQPMCHNGSEFRKAARRHTE